MIRGAIISPVGVNNPGSMYIRGDGQLLGEIPAGLLYWDRMLAPIAIRGLVPAYDSAVEGLLALDAADSFTIQEENTFSGDDIPKFVDRAVREFENYNRITDQTWSFLLGPGNLTLNEFGNHRAAKIELELWRNLPVPERNVPYQEILEFRRTRRPELLALHNIIEDISATYAVNPHETEALRKALDRADRAIDDLDRAYLETWPIKLTKALTTATLFDATIPAGLAVASGVQPNLALAVGSGYAALKASIGSFNTQPKIREEAKAFKYAMDARAL